MSATERLLSWLVRRLPPDRAAWGEAMLAESRAAGGRGHWRWAAGCLVTALRYSVAYNRRYVAWMAVIPLTCGIGLACAYSSGAWCVATFTLAGAALASWRLGSRDRVSGLLAFILIAVGETVFATTSHASIWQRGYAWGFAGACLAILALRLMTRPSRTQRPDA